MSFDINSPLNQELWKQGTALGLSPLAIAASMGTAQTENGGQTGGAPGDMGVKDGLGGAYGAFQLRGPRFDNLKTYAAERGMAWTDPAAQAGYHFAETAGKYPNAGVPSWVPDQYKTAADLDTAVDAMTDSEKPGGWRNGDDNATNVPSYGSRVGNSRLAFAAMQKAGLVGADGSMVAGAGAGGGGANPDAPAPDATPTGGQGTPGTGSSPAGILYAGGGQPAAAPTPTYQVPQTSMGQRLMLAGAALMARDNPAGASVLSSAVNSERANDTQNAQMLLANAKAMTKATTWTDKGTASNGKYRYQVDDNGNGRYVPVPQDAQDTTEDDKASKAHVVQFQTNADQLSNDEQLVNTANLLRDHLIKGDLDVKFDSQGKATIQNYSGSSNANSRDLKNMEALINVQVRNILSQEKGPATQMKIKQAMQQVLPDGGKWDNSQVQDALERMSTMTRANYANVANIQRQYATNYLSLVSGAKGVDGQPIDLGGHYDNNLQYWQNQEDDFAKRMPDFLKRHDAGQSGGAGSPGQPGSFLSFYGQPR